MFKTEEDLNENVFKKRFNNDDEFKKLFYLKEVYKEIISCKLLNYLFDNKGDKTEWSNDENVVGIYENDNWLSNDGNSEEWCVAYMDIRNDYTISEIINIKDEKNQDNINENNDKCIVEEDDVYCTPDPKIMESNALNSPI